MKRTMTWTEYTQNDLKLRAKEIREQLIKENKLNFNAIGAWFLRVTNNGTQLVVPYYLAGEGGKEHQFTEAL